MNVGLAFIVSSMHVAAMAAAGAKKAVTWQRRRTCNQPKRKQMGGQKQRKCSSVQHK